MRKFIILVFVTAHLHSVVQASRQVGVTQGSVQKMGLFGEENGRGDCEES